MTAINIAAFAAGWKRSPFENHDLPPWRVTELAAGLIAEAIGELGGDYAIEDTVAVHRSAIVEQNVVLKGPAILGPLCLIAAGSYLRGGGLSGRELHHRARI